MKSLLRWLRIALFIVAFGLGLWFALENAQTLPVSLFGLSLPSLPLGVWLLLFAAVGLFLGLFVGLWPAARLRRQLRARERQLARYEKELRQLRLQPIRD